jgi:hypothetical protein
MDSFDYQASAELFTNKSKWPRRSLLGYKRFDRAADAIRYVIESLPGGSQVAPWLEVGNDRFNASGIRALYEDEAYPLDRREPKPSPKQDTVDRNASPTARRPRWW